MSSKDALRFNGQVPFRMNSFFKGKVEWVFWWALLLIRFFQVSFLKKTRCFLRNPGLTFTSALFSSLENIFLVCWHGKK